MAFIDDIGLFLSARIGQQLAGASRGAVAIEKSILLKADVTTAQFVLTTGSLTLTLNAGALRKAGASTTLSEEGAGKLFTKIYGFVLINEATSNAPTGTPSFNYNYRSSTSNGDIGLGPGLATFLNQTPAADASFSVAVQMNGATGQKISVLVIGSAV